MGPGAYFGTHGGSGAGPEELEGVGKPIDEDEGDGDGGVGEVVGASVPRPTRGTPQARQVASSPKWTCPQRAKLRTVNERRSARRRG